MASHESESWVIELVVDRRERVRGLALRFVIWSLPLAALCVAAALRGELDGTAGLLAAGALAAFLGSAVVRRWLERSGWERLEVRGGRLHLESRGGIEETVPLGEVRLSAAPGDHHVALEGLGTTVLVPAGAVGVRRLLEVVEAAGGQVDVSRQVVGREAAPAAGAPRRQGRAPNQCPACGAVLRRWKRRCGQCGGDPGSWSTGP
jgi:hypothetical protein